MKINTGRPGLLILTGLILMALIQTPTPRMASAAPVIRGNPAVPANGTRSLRMEELWRAGAEDSDIFFGLIVQALAGPEGNLYLLDAQLSEIPVFSADGRFLRKLSREGEGPGEIQRAGTMLLMADGTLGVVQRFPGKLVLITTDGLPAGVIIPGDPTTGGREFLGDVKAVPGGLLMSGGHNSRDERSRLRHNYLSLFSLDGQPVREYYGRDDVSEFSARSIREADEYFIHDGRWDAAPDGTLYAALERDAYSLQVFDPAGPVRMTIRRAGPLWRRPGELMRKLESDWKATRRYQRFQTEQVFSENEPAISRVVVRDGEIRVLPATGQHDQPAGTLQTWDVFTPEGVFDHQLRIDCPGDGARDMLFFVGGDRAIVVAGYRDALDALRGTGSDAEPDEGEATPIEIIAYAIH